MSDPSVQLVEKYELDRCVSWISDNSFKRVCLQFPDNMLADSVEIALYIDERIESKTYILGDTSFFSCCVDELGCKHIDGDVIIHFGDSCLSAYLSLPVLYILPKNDLNLTDVIDAISHVLEKGPSLILYDVGYTHLVGELEEQVMAYQTVVAQLDCTGAAKTLCGPWCQADGSHKFSKFGYQFCTPSDLQSVVFIGAGKHGDNFMLSMKVPNFYSFDPDNGLVEQTQIKTYKRLSFLVEKVKNARIFGLLIGTVSVERYLEAIEHAKRLLKRQKRKCFIISVGKPTVAKLSNFPEIDAFVMVSCNKGAYINQKDVIVPIVTLLELELAFNENRSWDDPLATDFSFLLPGGDGYIEAPTAALEDFVDSSLTSGHRPLTNCTDSSSEIALRSDMTISTSSFSSKPRTWDGLEVRIDESAPSLAVPGRKGTAQGYDSEPTQ
ncbi:toxin resistance protein [Nesidiocoris tenuis]|uniref:2-(3-amino-3-carboxypropyl)histidine synthase subunit 2 n=1 Tax=Nesidiocoris tenuis TaxID=355587 RepID=A0ABN7AP38_9HEMI|nr:toxin resistance protein [Nesidiocoris tenuis]